MTLLQDIYKEERRVGLKRAQKEANDWFKDARANTNVLSVARHPEQKGYLHPGKIHVFSYNPKGKGVLDYYDKKPVVLALGRIKEKDGSVYDLGINLNFIPIPYKWYILNTIEKMYGSFFKQEGLGRASGNAILQAKIKYKYQVLKQILNKYGVGFAIRKYIPSRKSRVYICSYETWSRIAFLDIDNFEGVSYDEMIKKYKASKI